MKTIKRKRALELAMAGLERMIYEKSKTLTMAKQKYTPEGFAEVEREYAELVAAFQWLEDQSKQKQMELGL